MTFPFPRLMILGLLMIPTVPVLAQDAPASQTAVAPDGAPAKPMSDQEKRIDFLDKQLAPHVAKDFPGALASVHQFLEANPNIDPWERVFLTSAAGISLYFNTPAVKRAAIADSALGLLDEGLKEVEAAKYADPNIRARDIREYAEHKLQILIAEKRTPEAAQVLDHYWPLMKSSSDLFSTMQWCRHWCDIRDQQGQQQQATQGLVTLLEQLLPQRDQFPWDVSLVLSEECLRQGKDDEALSWAKVTFMMCSFDDWGIGQATPAVTKCLTANELSVAKANAFAKANAQVDPSAPNPLDAVPLPKFSTEAIKAQLADAHADLSPKTRISRLLTIGDYRGAMLLARSQLVADVGNQDNAREVARVFKAKDAGMARANGFLAFYQQGQGENPVPAFLKETEAAPAPTAR